ncbi:hypothetical protein WL766_05115 [Staphylococcus pasteuri]|nr:MULTISPECIES: hypothetical protein [Staphylococcus]ODB40418.1 hypothetical protein A9N02_11435 [Staphylococcus sp. AOAB]RQX27308.1 hypothetical protein DB792_10740 [Staphylococcus warneri]MBL3398548.1 hypothetical protein [Staphylococcus pasteuri]MBM6506446.1 hypothetical protein [Staphylococcus pasteuri]MCO0862101.1 hypothetical protein [Staphylococcus pasteuri]
MDNKENEKNINNDDEKSELDKEIEAELIEYMNSDKKEEKEEKKKYKTAGFIVALVIAILYMVKFAKHFMYIDLHSLIH